MNFDARIIIQGMGTYVPHVNSDQLLVLFPNQDFAESQNLRDFENSKICRHHAVIQFDARNLDPRLGRFWMSIDASGNWIGADSNSSQQLDLGKPRLDGIPSIDEILRVAKMTDFSEFAREVLPAGADVQRRLRAGLYLDQGEVAPDARYNGPVVWKLNGADLPVKRGSRISNVTNTVRVELGTVSRFNLRLKSFAGEERLLPLYPLNGKLEVWVRHICEISKPQPDAVRESTEAADHDFALNYSLLSDLSGLIARYRQHLPYPMRADSWTGTGIPKGDPANRCGKSQSSAQAFDRI